MGFCFEYLFSFFLTTIVLIIHFYGLIIATTALPTTKIVQCYGGNYVANSTFQSNLNLLLPSLSLSNTALLKNGYKNATVGQNPDTVYGALQCAGDITPKICQDCIITAAQEIVRNNTCPSSKQALIWYDQCWLRYSDRFFFSIMEEYPNLYQWTGNNITNNPVQFNHKLAGLLDDLVKEVVSYSNGFLFATGETIFTEFQKIYGLVQCTSDLESSDCNRCLRGAIAQLPSCCDRKEGVRIVRASCKFRYEIYPFFQSRVPTSATATPPPITPPSTTNTTTTNSKQINSFKLAATIVVPSVIAVLSTIAILCFYFRRKKPKKKFDDVDEIRSAESLQFNFSTIRAATDNFSDANKLGEGGFGSVYKGTLLHGEEIAVKRLSRNSCQGEQEFKNEVVLVAKLQHKNLVRLLGFCFDGEEKLLIYEFMPNASLDQFIFDAVKRTYLDWETRYKVIGGIARGLLYLHEDSRLKIIHRDLKASNILLDADMIPKISDFGMARLFVVDQTQANTDRIVGTHGYMAPEYAIHGQFSVKSDVFSFGVLVLEILHGQKNNSFYESITGGAQDLLSYAWRLWENGTALELLDPTLRENCSISEVLRCVHIGLLCVQDTIANRPTMASIILMLNNNSTALPLPSRPAYFVWDQPIEERSLNEASITELDPR